MTSEPASGSGDGGGRTPRAVADRFVDTLVALDPVLATTLGVRQGGDRLPDLTPEGLTAVDDARRATLTDLSAVERAAGGLDRLDDAQRRCARLLRERLEAACAVHAAGEELRSLGTLFSPVQQVRGVFTLMPTADDDDWRTVAARLTRVPQAYDGYRRALALGAARGLLSGPAQVDAVIAQLDQWQVAGGAGRGWFEGFAAGGPAALASELEPAARGADGAVAQLRHWLATDYAPQVVGAGRDPVGAERYARQARFWTGSDLDLGEAYAWAWQEFARLDGELRAEAQRVLPGAGLRAAMDHLDTDGEAVQGVQAVRDRLQRLMDDTIAALDGVHVDLAEPLRRVEAMIAPEGSAAAPYYSAPSSDFSRPGRTWLPTLGQTRFPMWQLVSTWYHEGVPGHHLQLAQWRYVAPQLSRYQTSVGSVGADVEGWALYAERLMDELGYLEDPGHRLGFLDAQQMRAVRVIIDIGMHAELQIPLDQGVAEAFHPGERWTPQLARAFFGEHSGRPAAFLDSEIVRYLGGPGQAISYKLGERAWLAGRERARRAHLARGRSFDLKAWHMAALSQGSLGLDHLVDELGRL